jgi:outer membrane protein insertion porin family
MSKRRIAVLGFLLVMGCGVLSVPAAMIKGIEVENQGAYPLDRESVLAYLSLKEGDEFDRMAVSEDVKRLQKTGRFSFVEASVKEVPGGFELIYRIEAKSRIRSLRIRGADEIGNKDVRELIELGVGDLVDDDTLAVKTLAVREKYRERYYPEASVTWDLEIDEETGLADVSITVDAGDKARVRKILFSGNTVFSDGDLRDMMQQKGTRWYSWITGGGEYEPDKLALDLSTIRQAYLDKGYLDAYAGPPEISDGGKGRINLLIPVVEGQLYEIRDIDLSGVTIFDSDTVFREITLKPGDVASVAEIRKAAGHVRDYYGRRGYIDTRVRPVQQTEPEKALLDLDFTVSEGNLAYIRDVRIKGNTRTKDKVIRRELTVYPGDIFNEVKVRTSERRLWNLGYFSYVTHTRESTLKPDYYDVTYEVEEKRTGQFMVGAGFSSVDDLLTFIEISQGNFNLLGWPSFTGGGQKLKLRLQLGTERTDAEVSFVEPWLFNRKLALGVDFFRHDRRFLSDDYDQKNLGSSISLSRAVSPYDRLTLKYGLERVEIYDVEDTASEAIKKEEGKRTKSAVTLTLRHDTRHLMPGNVFVATSGNRSSISAMLAGGFLGGSTDIYMFEGRTSQYIPLWFGHVLNIRGWLAVVDSYNGLDEVPIFERLFLGGARTMRGFKYRDVGPKDDEGEPLGGNTAAYLSAEYYIPITRMLRFATYYDVGMVWDKAYYMNSDINSDVGIGLRLDMPGFPLRLDYAWPIEADEYNDKPSGRFSFLIGYIM